MPIINLSELDWRHYTLAAVLYLAKGIVIILLIRYLPAQAKQWCVRMMFHIARWIKHWTLALLRAIARMA